MLVSSLQKRIYDAEQLHPGVYNITFFVNLRPDSLDTLYDLTLELSSDLLEPLDPALHDPQREPRLRNALRQLILRHDPLRTYFPRPRQPEVLHDFEVPIEHHTLDRSDLRSFLSTQAITRHFHLDQPTPVIKCKILHVDDLSLVWIIVHHIAFDGQSIPIFKREFLHLYRSDDPLPELTQSYQRFCEIGDINKEGDVAWWKSKGIETYLLDLPYTSLRECQEGAFVSHTGKGYGERLRGLQKQYKLTHFSFIQSLFCYLIGCVTGQSKVLTFFPYAIRSHLHNDKLIGMFATTLPVLYTLETADTLHGYLSRVKGMYNQCMRHSGVQLESVYKVEPQVLISETSIKQTRGVERVKFDWQLGYYWDGEKDEMTLSCWYRERRFEGERMRRFLEVWFEMLEDADQSVSEVQEKYKLCEYKK